MTLNTNKIFLLSIKILLRKALLLYCVEEFLDLTMRMTRLVLMILGTLSPFSWAQQQELTLTCPTPSTTVNQAMEHCWTRLQNQWHFKEDSELQEHILQDSLIDYFYQDQKVVLNFDKKKIFQTLHKSQIQFTADFPFRVLLLTLKQKKVDEFQNKFVLDTAKTLIERCYWETATPSFDLRELFLATTSFRLPLTSNLLSLADKYQSFGIIGLNMDENHQLTMNFISPFKGQIINSFDFSDIDTLKHWLDTQIDSDFLIQREPTYTLIKYDKPHWNYESVTQNLDKEIAVANYSLDHLASDSIVMRIGFYYSPKRIEYWLRLQSELHQQSIHL